MGLAFKGFAKLIEESGEVQQICGKLLAYQSGEHPDGKGNLWIRLEDELADLRASLSAVIENNALDSARISVQTLKDIDEMAQLDGFLQLISATGCVQQACSELLCEQAIKIECSDSYTGMVIGLARSRRIGRLIQVMEFAISYLDAAITLVIGQNSLDLDKIRSRADHKRGLFDQWRQEEK